MQDRSLGGDFPLKADISVLQMWDIGKPPPDYLQAANI
jgi:hypothetical protein